MTVKCAGGPMLKTGCGFGLLFLFMNIAVSHSHEQDISIQSQLSYLKKQLGSVLEHAVSVDQRVNVLDHRITALDHRVNSLDQRLNSLGQPGDVSDAAEKWKEEQNGGRYELLDVLEEEKGGEMALPLVLQDDEIPFRLTTVRRKDTGYVHAVTLHYRSASMPRVLLKIASYPVEVPSQELGTVTVYIPKEENSPDPFVYFLFPDYFLSVHLNLTSSPQMNLPLPMLKIAQGNDITFQSGEELRIEFDFHVEGDVEGIEKENANIQFLSKSDEKKQTVDRFHLFNVDTGYANTLGNLRLELTSMEGWKGYRKGTALFRSFIGDAEGILQAFVTLNFNCFVNCLVKQITKQHHLNVYRKDHEGPFPDGFIGFVRDDYEQNVNQVRCDISPYARPCAILCEVVGSGVTSVKIEKVGEAEDVDSSRTRHLTAGKGGYWSDAVLIFTKLGKEDSGEYRCTASSDKEEIRQDFVLLVEGGEDD